MNRLNYMIYPSWCVAPDNTYTPKSLEQAMLGQCLKLFHIPTAQNLDDGVIYEPIPYIKEEYKTRFIYLQLAAPSKIFLEAFREFSLLWHSVKPGKDWKVCTDKALKKHAPHGHHANETRNIKHYVKPSQYKYYVFLCISCQNLSYPSYNGIELMLFKRKEGQKSKDWLDWLYLIGTQYKKTYLEKTLKNAHQNKDKFQTII